MHRPIARKSNIVVQEMKDETLIYDLNINKAYCLNETSALVWRMCDGKNTAREIGDKMSKQLKELVGEDLVWLALNQLDQDSLLEEDAERNDYFQGLSRREVIRKVGFASVVALPVISSLIAPNAATAQSGGLPLLSTCTGNPDCASGFCNDPFFGGTGPVCCVPGSISAPGEPVSSCNTVAGCTTLAATGCCSGIQTFTQTGCAIGPNPPVATNGSCICA